MNVPSDNDSKGFLNTPISLERSQRDSLPSTERAINTRTNKITDSIEPGYVQLSNGLIQSCETCHTFTV